MACAARSSSCGDDTLKVAWAVDTIAHEAWHLHGVADEAETECRSLQTMAWTAQRLGLAEPEAQGLARTMWETGYEMMIPAYRSSQCGDGGAWDPRWP